MAILHSHWNDKQGWNFLREHYKSYDSELNKSENFDMLFKYCRFFFPVQFSSRRIYNWLSTTKEKRS